jgi:hypothetical protein
MAKLALVHRVEVGKPKEFDKPRTKEEALAQLEERVDIPYTRLLSLFAMSLRREAVGWARGCANAKWAKVRSTCETGLRDSVHSRN